MFEKILGNLGNFASLMDVEQIFKSIPEKTLETWGPGNIVHIKMNTRFEVLDVDINEDMLKKDSKYLLEEMIASAMNDLTKKVMAEATKEMKKKMKDTGVDINKSIDPEIIKDIASKISIKDPAGNETNINIEGAASPEMIEKMMEKIIQGADNVDDEDYEPADNEIPEEEKEKDE